MCFEPRFKRFIFCLSFTSYFKSNLTGLFVDYIRDFTDALILARQEAEDEEDKEVLSELTDLHLVNTISDIFGGRFIIEKKPIFFLVLIGGNSFLQMFLNLDNNISHML